MTSEKYIGLDVHQATISVAVMDASGKLVMESILETKASTLLQFLAGLRGNVLVTFEEGTWWRPVNFLLSVSATCTSHSSHSATAVAIPRAPRLHKQVVNLLSQTAILAWIGPLLNDKDQHGYC